jgi:HSP20 family protein
MAESAKDPKQGKVTVDIEKAPAAQSGGSLTRFDEFERDMERMFEGFLSRNWLRPFRDFPTLRDLPSLRGGLDFGRMPKADIVERDNEVVVRAELPGIDKKDLKVSLTDHTISIRASTRKETKEEKGEYYRREITTGEISRTLTLPADVDGQAAKAEFKDGLLEIVVPKITKAKRVDVDVK